MLSVFYGLITKNNNMELKDLEEMFKMEQELDIPHRDRWYNKDFDKRELEAEQSVKNCNIPDVSNRRELYFAFMKEYNSLMGDSSEHQILKEEVEVLLAKYSC